MKFQLVHYNNFDGWDEDPDWQPRDIPEAVKRETWRTDERKCSRYRVQKPEAVLSEGQAILVYVDGDIYVPWLGATHEEWEKKGRNHVYSPLVWTREVCDITWHIDIPTWEAFVEFCAQHDLLFKDGKLYWQ